MIQYDPIWSNMIQYDPIWFQEIISKYVSRCIKKSLAQTASLNLNGEQVITGSTSMLCWSLPVVLIRSRTAYGQNGYDASAHQPLHVKISSQEAGVYDFKPGIIMIIPEASEQIRCVNRCNFIKYNLKYKWIVNWIVFIMITTWYDLIYGLIFSFFSLTSPRRQRIPQPIPSFEALFLSCDVLSPRSSVGQLGRMSAGLKHKKNQTDPGKTW